MGGARLAVRAAGSAPLLCTSSGKCRSGETSGVPALSAPGDCEFVPSADVLAPAAHAFSFASVVLTRSAFVFTVDITVSLLLDCA